MVTHFQVHGDISSSRFGKCTSNTNAEHKKASSQTCGRAPGSCLPDADLPKTGKAAFTPGAGSLEDLLLVVEHQILLVLGTPK